MESVAFSPILQQELEQIKILIHSLMLSASPRIQTRLCQLLFVINKSWLSWSLTPRRCLWQPFLPPSLAKHIQALLLKRLCGHPKLGSISEDS
ncbi:exportin-2 [Corchorus olitorius]|uniref:Exportin-2 n=1 Tax=Corchorus olitorius TaxID=93759 RepID=A0A1R3KVH1_9ROSI|nr:exportin-2 [Corchorus olitorius]